MRKISDDEDFRKFISYAKKPNELSILSGKYFKLIQEKNKGFRDYLDLLNSYRSNNYSNLKIDGSSEGKKFKLFNSKGLTSMSSIKSIKKLSKKNEEKSASVDEKSLKNLYSSNNINSANSVNNPYSFGYKLHYKNKFIHNSIDLAKVKSVELRLLPDFKENILSYENENHKNLNNLYFKTEHTNSQSIRQSYSNGYLLKKKLKNLEYQKNKDEILSPQELDNLINILYNRQNGLINSNDTFGVLENQNSNIKNLIFLKEIAPNKYFQNLLVTMAREVEIKNSKNKLVSKEQIKNFINHELDKIYTNQNLNETSSDNDEEVDDAVLPDINQLRGRKKRGTYDLDYELKTQNLNDLDGTEVDEDNWALNAERRFVTNIDHKDNLFMFENKTRYNDDKKKNEWDVDEKELQNQKSQKSKLVLQNKNQKTRNNHVNAIKQLLEENSSYRIDDKSSTTYANTREVIQTTEESVQTTAKKKINFRTSLTYRESGRNKSLEIEKESESIHNKEIKNLKNNNLRNSILGLKFKNDYEAVVNEQLNQKFGYTGGSRKKRNKKKIRSNKDSDASDSGSVFDSMYTDNSQNEDKQHEEKKSRFSSNKNILSLRSSRRNSLLELFKNEELRKSLYKEKKYDSNKSLNKLSKFTSRKSISNLNDRINESNKKLNQIIEKHKSKFSGSPKNLQSISQFDYGTITTMTDESNYRTIYNTDSAGSVDSESVEKNFKNYRIDEKKTAGNKSDFKKNLKSLYDFEILPKVNFNKSATNFQLGKNKKDGNILFGIDLDFYNALKILKNNEKLIQLKKRRRKEKRMENNQNTKYSKFKKDKNWNNKKITFNTKNQMYSISKRGSNDDYDLDKSILNRLKEQNDIIKIEEKLKMNKTLMFKSQKNLVEVINSYEDDEKETDDLIDNLKQREQNMKLQLKGKIKSSILRSGTGNKIGNQLKFFVDKTEKDNSNEANKTHNKNDKNKDLNLNKNSSYFLNKKNTVKTKSKGSQKQLINVYGSSKNLIKEINLNKDTTKDNLRTKTFYRQKTIKKDDFSDDEVEKEINDRDRLRTRISTVVDRQMLVKDDNLDMNLQKTLEKFRAAKIKNSNQNKAEELLKELLTFTMMRSKENVSLQDAKKDLVVIKEIDALINSDKIDNLPKHVDFDLLIKNRVINKDQRDILMANFIHNNKNRDIVFEILELIRQQEEIKRKNWERRIRMHKDKALYEKNMINRPRRPSELARE
jgi:hypothetical protein